MVTSSYLMVQLCLELCPERAPVPCPRSRIRRILTDLAKQPEKYDKGWLAPTDKD
jgi:hypothetical protein